MERYADRLLDWAVLYAPKVVGAILVLIIGFWIVSGITKLFYKTMMRAQVAADLIAFLRGLIAVGLRILVVFSAAGIVGIETTSFVAVLAAAGFAVGLALQGSLSNFAAGVLILFFKPYRMGDVIGTQGFIGTVKEIQILTTMMTTLDNRVIVIPNGSIINGPIENYSMSEERQLDITFGIAYENDIDEARAILQNVMESCPGYLVDKKHQIMVKELADSAVNLGVRFWTSNKDFWTATYYMQENVKKAFDQQGISIPFPQVNLHVANTNGVGNYNLPSDVKK